MSASPSHDTLATTPAPVSARVDAIDVLRGLAIVAVVGLHVGGALMASANPTDGAFRVSAAVHLLSGFGVPMFVALSAASLTLRYPHPFSSLERGARFLGRRLRVLLPGYVCWSLLAASHHHPQALHSLRSIAGLLVDGNAGPQFYFIPLIIQLYLVWPLLVLVRARLVATPARSLVLVAGAGVFTVVWWNLSARGVLPSSTWLLLPFYAVYVTAGMVAGEHLLAPGRGLRSAVVAPAATTAMILTATILIATYFARVGARAPDLAIRLGATIFQTPQLLYSMSVLSVAAVLASATSSGASPRASHGVLARMLRTLGLRSYGIYLTHYLVLEIVVYRVFGKPQSWTGAGGPATLAIAAMITLTLALSWVLVAGVGGVPGLAAVMGNAAALRRSRLAPG